jgi:serine/threonine-protein kinase
MPPHGPGGQPRQEEPHPWQSQLRAARDRNEQTQVQYLDPSEDPLRRRPQRQVARPQQQPRPAAQPRQQPPQPQPGYGHPQQYAPQPQRYAPPAPQPEPRRPAREPRPPRQRSANPMRIPGLGCLKGCLFTIVILFVAGWLVWELTPLQEWIGTGKGYWQQLSDWIGQVSDWVGALGGN